MCEWVGLSEIGKVNAKVTGAYNGFARQVLERQQHSDFWKG